ncbi:hypothetical protein CYMTET_40294 [Cymbomonas tetramitiformis]|uniref:AB hydrolase-1 domain-containing protein n=1 Tax=Cymbomonas tetramitiformis TaxID=36881 RepID=A0AAE0C8B5_9CHLO|nr:hypothetical protein CYMTET_40294 [Cymbomonas tetramitiformis]|eukprot:gene28589-35461_t
MAHVNGSPLCRYRKRKLTSLSRKKIGLSGRISGALRTVASSESKDSEWVVLGDSDSNPTRKIAGQEANAFFSYADTIWEWEQHKVNYVVAGAGPPVILIHGFGANLRHFRRNIPVLAQSHTVYAIDLLGFGKSDKPIGFDFSMERWRDLVACFIEQIVQEPVVLVGNSIGSLISLMVAAESPMQKGLPSTGVRGIVLLNCAGGMNSKFIMESPLENDDPKYKLFSPLFWLVDRILSTRFIAEPLFNNVKTEENIRQVLKNVYVNTAAVDDELVDLFIAPSLDVGAFETFTNILTGEPGPRPEVVARSVKCPMCIVWGPPDVVTDLEGPIGKFFRELSEKSGPEVELKLVDTGHCPHDDDPETVNSIIKDFLDNRLLN